MSAGRIVRGARSMISSSSFSINRRGVSALLSDPAPSAASLPLSSGPFLYSKLRGQVLHFSQFVEANGKCPFPAVDTHALVKRMEAEEIPLNQAEVITSVIREIVKVSYENMAQSFASKGELQKSEMTHDANICKLQNQLQNSQDHLSSLMQREIEKLRSDTDKQHNELKPELLVEMATLRGDIGNKAEKLSSDVEKMLAEQQTHNDKMLAGQQAHSDKMNYELRVLVESIKFHGLKYFVGTIVSVIGMASGIVFAIIRMMK